MSQNSSPRKIDPSIVAALIGVIGTIAVTLITLNANKQSAPTPSPTPMVASTNTTVPSPAPTDTVPPGESTSTPAPATDTPEPTFTFTATPAPVALGQDWGVGCISSLWKPFPASIPVVEKDGCLLEPVHVFSASNGSLSFLGSRAGSGGEEVYGLFAPLLPESGSVTIFIRLKDLSNVDLWAGVFAGQDIASQGMLMIIPAGNVKNRLVVQKEISSYDNIQSTQMISQGDGFIIAFEFNPNSARALVNRNLLVTNPVSIPSAQKWLFLGYKGLSGNYRIEGEFFNFEVK